MTTKFELEFLPETKIELPEEVSKNMSNPFEEEGKEVKKSKKTTAKKETKKETKKRSTKKPTEEELTMTTLEIRNRYQPLVEESREDLEKLQELEVEFKNIKKEYEANNEVKQALEEFAQNQVTKESLIKIVKGRLAVTQTAKRILNILSQVIDLYHSNKVKFDKAIVDIKSDLDLQKVITTISGREDMAKSILGDLETTIRKARALKESIEAYNATIRDDGFALSELMQLIKVSLIIDNQSDDIINILLQSK